MVIDFSPIFAFLKKYKIQPKPNEVLSWKVMRKVNLHLNRNFHWLINFFFKVVSSILFNHLLVFPSTFIAYKVMTLRGIPDIREIPSLQRLILDFLVSEICWEISFYYIHRLFHTKYLYKNFHKKHHEWSAPYAMMSHYVHPIDYLTASLIPPFVGVAVMGSHLFTIYAFTAYGVVESCLHHCGFRLPMIPVVEYHDYHHKKWVSLEFNWILIDFVYL